MNGTTVTRFNPKTGQATVVKFTPGHQEDKTRGFNSGVAIPQQASGTLDMSKIAEAQAQANSIFQALKGE